MLFSQFVMAVAPLLIILPLCILIEAISPREGRGRLSRWPTVSWVFFQPGFFLLAAWPLIAIWRHVDIDPLIDLTPLGDIAGTLALLLIFDFLRYVAHVAQHHFWWPVHAVHHSIRELHAAKSYAHPFESLAEVFLVVVPLGFIQAPAGAMLWVGAISGFQNLLIHCPIRVHWGPLRHVLVDSHFHRVHHSIEARHHDRNFGIVFSFWDRIFRTWVPSGPHEWPPTGVPDLEPPRTLAGLLLHPLQHFQGPRPSRPRR